MHRALLISSLVLALGGSVAVSGALAQPAPDRAAIQSEIWAKELTIYRGRGGGDVAPYVNSMAAEFASWPPQARAPVDGAALKAGAAKIARSQEQLEMTFVDLRLSGDTAVIYYRTHMTVRADGTPCDLHYEVTHTWVREGGDWRVLGGMAREAPAR